MPKLGDKIKAAGLKVSKPKQQPVWDGPCDPSNNGGVTQSMLQSWLSCRERFRLRVIEGLRVADAFNHRLEYGSMWHTCEEALAKQSANWENHLRNYCANLAKQYPTQQQQVLHWMNVCKAQFPAYVQYWAKHPDVKDRTPLLQEQVFHVPYLLPSRRSVYLRGKFDSVDLIGKGKTAGVYLQENKTKGDIKEEQMKRQLGFDLQTGLYLVALIYSGTDLAGYWKGNIEWGKQPIKGIRYNVIRRPLSGGAGTIRQYKPSKSNPLGETDADFYERLRVLIQEEADAAIKEHRDCAFFMRWRVEFSPGDIKRFEQEFLIPCMEELCDWHEWVSGGDPWRAGNRLHWRHPYGVYNVLDQGGSSDLDEYIASGSEIGLTRGNELFRELQ